ncbi:hypothetical protein AVEN_199841-1 [Araneus ventricosus]|uniref:Uncharacterized protein n=1 Tax=Araneus ventricosus TaxID=182803 RepID=A0A4Y2DV20_ARAVE|nr:hypothetical protein AVEN_199841-1 [Araneus ventricosus]
MAKIVSNWSKGILKRVIHEYFFLGTRHAKRLRQCKNPMIIGVYRRRIWNSNNFGVPFSHKSETRSFEASDKSPACGWERWGREMCMGVRLEKSGLGGKSALSKK